MLQKEETAPVLMTIEVTFQKKFFFMILLI